MKTLRAAKWLCTIVCCTALAMVGVPPSVGADDPAPQPRYEARGRRDPFAPLVRDGHFVGMLQASHPSMPVLSGILWDPRGPSMALINDVEVKVGDTVGDYQVMEIQQDAVVLRAGGKSVVLRTASEVAPGRSPRTTTGGAQP